MNWQRWADIVHHKHRTNHLLQKDRLFRCASKHSHDNSCRPATSAIVDRVRECSSLGKCLGDCNRVCNCFNSASIDIAFFGETDLQRLTSCLFWPVNILSGLILRIFAAGNLRDLFSAFLRVELPGREHLPRTFGLTFGAVPIRVRNSNPDSGRPRTNHI